MTDTQKHLLEQELQLLGDATEVLTYSFDKCAKIGIKAAYLPDELESFESLTSRFARLSDILIQKVFRLIDRLDLETEGSIRDRINRAEKKDLIGSAEIFVEIRMLRNDIAHEYLREAIQELYVNVLSLTPALLDSVERVKKYCEKF
ncbi:hypothetical protein GMSM_17350 [Geomonas sp. Red276]